MGIALYTYTENCYFCAYNELDWVAPGIPISITKFVCKVPPKFLVTTSWFQASDSLNQTAPLELKK